MKFNNFDASTVEPSDSYDLVPAGWYQAIIVESEQVATKAGTGSYLKLRFDIIDGEHSGRVLFDNLNLDNPNQIAVEIAYKALSAICRAVGVMKPESSSDLHDIPLMIKVGIQPAKGEYEASNRIKGYKAVGATDEQSSDEPSSKPTAKASKPTAKAGKKPWEK